MPSAATSEPAVLLSFDAEEFDLPLERGVPIPRTRQFTVGADGLRRALDLLDETGVTATFFTTASLAREHPELIRRLAQRHELASHGLTHAPASVEELGPAKDALEQIGGVAVVGFRPPRLAQLPAAAIRDAGFLYHSSENPTWLPGRYNHFFRPRHARVEHGVVHIPASVTPLVRFPLFWLSFKNAPRWMTRLATRSVLATGDRHAALYFHPWELCDLAEWCPPLPRHIAGRDGARFTAQLREHILWLKARASFQRYDAVAQRLAPTHAAAARSN